MLGCLVCVVPPGEKDTKIQMCEPDVRIQCQRTSQMRLSRLLQVFMHFRVAQVRQNLRVLRLTGQFHFELTSGFHVSPLLPVKVAEAEVGIGRHSRCLYCGLKLRSRGLLSVGCVEHLAQKDVNRRGIRVLRKSLLSKTGQNCSVVCLKHASWRDFSGLFGWRSPV